MAGTSDTSHNIRYVNLDDPDREAIAAVLGEALGENYTESSVEWVPCPDLSKPPFNLAAEGICGNTALLDFGDMSYLELPAEEKKTLNFKQVLKDISRDNKDSFIFGSGVYQHYYRANFYLRELVLNTLFSSSTHIEREKNRSQFIKCGTNYTCMINKLQLPELACTGQGTYFLCDGSTTNSSVLKVRTVKPLVINALSRNVEFITSMQEALETRFGSSNHFVALGGVFTVNTINNKPWKHLVDLQDWENPSRCAFKRYCKINSPETMITTFNSSTVFHPKNAGLPIKLNSSTSIHSLSHHSASVTSSVSCGHWGEYLGYFCPATTLYRIDERPQ